MLTPERFDAVVFDTDGVITDTAAVHMAAWKELFDEFLAERAAGGAWDEFTEDDYLAYVDGKPRYDGVASFLASRGVELPWGETDDPPSHDTVCALGNKKNGAFLHRLEEAPPEPFPGTVAFIHEAREAGMKTAMISASRNAEEVLTAAGVIDLFDARVDGKESSRLQLAGKPDPAIFLEAARRLGVPPERAVVVEDARAGVEAGRRGGFGLVVGVDRVGQRDELAAAGADLVVGDLAELTVSEAQVPLPTLPSAVDEFDAIAERLGDRTPAVFLDYDGTLTPIVDDPMAATLTDAARRAIRRLSRLCPVAVVSGRDRDVVRDFVDLDDLVYAGSHGFDILGPDVEHQHPLGLKAQPALEDAARRLEEELGSIPGAIIERKRFAVAIHFRMVDPDERSRFEPVVRRVAEQHPGLRVTTGKMIYELRPKVEWDKGKALRWLLGELDLDRADVLPFYLGDDDTDEDALRELRSHGVGVVVGTEDRPTVASYRVRDPGEVVSLLTRLADLLEVRTHTDRWTLRYDRYEPEEEGLREALCTLGNGYVATRGALPESAADGVHYPGTYLAGVFNRLSDEIAGRSIENESMVNMPNWLDLAIRVEGGEWLRLDEVEVLHHEVELDLRRGMLTRSSRIAHDGGRITTVTQRRLVSMDDRHLLGLETTVLPETWSGRVEVRSGIDGEVTNSGVARYSALAATHLERVDLGEVDEETIELKVRTNQSHVDVAMAARTRVASLGEYPPTVDRFAHADATQIAHHLRFDVQEGEPVVIEKVASVFTSRDTGISEASIAARDRVKMAGTFEALRRAHVIAWSHVWNRCRLDVGDDEPTALALNLHVFHVVQTVSKHSADLDVGVPARGLHGEAYRGHIFWDELFILPFLDLRLPNLARNLLMYRYRRLPWARRAAAEAGYAGAMFPWQSGSDGREETQVVHLNPKSGRWLPDGSHLQRHIGIAVAYNVWTYYESTGDTDFLAHYGAELLLEIARFWASAASYDRVTGRWHIRGVMGPDEYHERYPDADQPGLDDNAYTNVMAVWCIRRAFDALSELSPRRAEELKERLHIDREDLDRWGDITRKMHVPHHDGRISQFEGYGDLLEFDWEGYRARYGDIQRLDRILEAEGDSTNRYKLSKQADVLMLFYLLPPREVQELIGHLGYELTDDGVHDLVDYYLARTSHGSTLSGLVHSWVLARTDRRRSWSFFLRALRSDLFDVQGGTTAEGVHLGAMAGTVDLVQRCFTGLEPRGGVLWLDPALPPQLGELNLSVRYRGAWLDLSFDDGDVVVSSHPGPWRTVRIGYRGEVSELGPGDRLELRQ